MKNQKTLIFSLSVMLFLAVSFIVYSWNEPTQTMPSGYTAPLNTSSTAQTKIGEIGASVFRDAEDPDYYINPSGDSIVSGKITTSGNISAARPTETSHMTTKGYVDEQIALVQSIVTGVQPLINGVHTWQDCEDANGEIIDIFENNITLKQCRFNTATCPTGWSQYENYSKTDPAGCQVSCFCDDPTPCVTSPVAPGHDWSNKVPAVTGCNVYCSYGNISKKYTCAHTCTGYNCNINKCCYIVGDSRNCSVPIVQIGCY